MSDFTENSQSANRLVTLSPNDTPRKWVEENWEKCLVSGDPGHSRLGHGQDTAVIITPRAGYLQISHAMVKYGSKIKRYNQCEICVNRGVPVAHRNDPAPSAVPGPSYGRYPLFASSDCFVA